MRQLQITCDFCGTLESMSPPNTIPGGSLGWQGEGPFLSFHIDFELCSLCRAKMNADVTIPLCAVMAALQRQLTETRGDVAQEEEGLHFVEPPMQGPEVAVAAGDHLPPISVEWPPKGIYAEAEEGPSTDEAPPNGHGHTASFPGQHRGALVQFVHAWLTGKPRNQGDVIQLISDYQVGAWLQDALEEEGGAQAFFATIEHTDATPEYAGQLVAVCSALGALTDPARVL